MKSVIGSIKSKSYGFLAVILIGLLSLCSSAAESDDVLSVKRQQELIYLLEQDCGSCHGMLLKGGLGPSLLVDNLREKPKQYLIKIISEGLPGTAMSPWKNILSPTEIEFLADYLLLAKHQQKIKDTSAE